MLAHDSAVVRTVRALGAVIEHPWSRRTDDAVFKHPETGRWLALVTSVPASRLGMEGEAELDLLTVKAEPARIEALAGCNGFHQAVRMNGRHWVSVRLDGSVDDGVIASLLEEGFKLVGPKEYTTSPAVHKSMQGNKGRDTKPEMAVRAMLREMGFSGYRLQWSKCPGRPDIAFPGRRLAIYVNGCFWHRCPVCNLSVPKSNERYWAAKFERNVERDRRNLADAAAQGWRTLVIWECELKKDKVEATRDTVYRFITLEGDKDEG